MTAILLAAGLGKRMGPGAGPKCLLVIGGRSLLRRTLESLRAIGVGEVVLVTGYQAESVAAEARAYRQGMELTVLENPRYREGAILSLWTARGHLDREVLVMDADVLCPQSAFERLAGSIHENCLLADGSVRETGEEQMLFGREGRVLHIAKRAPEELRRGMTLYGESLGFLRLSAKAAGRLRHLLDEKVEAGWVTIEHEQAYADLFKEERVGFERVDGIAWTEIDTSEDLRRAEEEVLPRWSTALCVNRAISGWFLPGVVRLPLTPNQWTFLSLLLGLSSLFFISQGNRCGDLWGAFLFQMFYLVDNWDGEVARHKGLSTRWGGWFDVAVDGVVQAALPVALAAGLQARGWPGSVLLLGWLAAAGVVLDFVVTLWAKARGFGPAIFGSGRGFGSAGNSKLGRWLRINWTNENFSWGVVLAILLQGQGQFLAAMAVGCQLYWIRFLWRERRRLAPVRLHG